MNYYYVTRIKRSMLNILFLLTASTLLLSSCKDEVVCEPHDPLDEMIGMLDLEGLPEVEHPADNPITNDKIELGRLIFWDPIVGGEKDMACATCHHPDFGYGDGLDLPIGVNGTGLGPDRTENTGGLSLAEPIKRVPRNAPTVINSAYNGLTSYNGYNPDFSPMFWDNRADGLEGQCQGPPTSKEEMRGEAYEDVDALDSVIARLAAIPEYVQLFTECFGGPNPVNLENYTFALSAFERSIVADDSPYDRYVAGDKSALTNDQKEGLILFYGKARCANCHYGPMFSDYDLHVMGIPDNPRSPKAPDSGADEEWKFRTPTLRNVSLTGPYMHNGVFDNLRDVVEYMNAGVSGNPNVTADMLENDMTSLGLTDQEISQLVSFLEALTDENFDKKIPEEVPSGLPVGGSI